MNRAVTQFGTALLVGGRLPKQMRCLHKCNTLLDKKGGFDKNKLEKAAQEGLKKLTSNDGYQNAKVKMDGIWRQLDLKLAEFGFTPQQTTDKDIDALRYVISLMLILWLLFLIMPGSGKKFLSENFMLSSSNAGRVYPFVTSLLLHTDIFGLLFSCLILYSLAPVVMVNLGRARFWQVAVGAGVASNVYFVIHENASQKGWMPVYSVQSGAHACCSSLIAVTCLMQPNMQMMFFFVPAKALHIGYFVIGYDAFKILMSLTGSSRADGVGGGLFGAGFWYFVLNQRTLGL
eukprot:TRINITY_DN7640_c0_g2_i1.p1 TRINITY_DN7640_c0_g2~~TRINITY_DN7640_c0_g2_i1.p1  ORF type:complete len:289 (+),score=64.60 TRINITY_DN7640_c0_g2_i1:76-942(+)